MARKTPAPRRSAPEAAAPRSGSAARRKAPPPPSGTRRTIDSLLELLGPPNDRLRQLLYRNVPEARLLALGKRVDSDDILDAIPEFLGMVREIHAQLAPGQRKLFVGYTPAFDPILIDETVKLRERKRLFDARPSAGAATQARQRKALRQLMSASTALRDQAAVAMRDILGASEDAAELETIKGTAETADKLAVGLERIANLIEIHHRRDSEIAELFDEVQLTAEYVTELRQTASTLRTTSSAADFASPETRVTQRMLDVQDGVVLHLMGLIYRAFREAHNRDQAILLPPLGRLAPFFEKEPGPPRRGAGRKAPAKAKPGSDGDGTLH
jgi:hypothetical protein